MKERIIKTYENFNLDDLNIGGFFIRVKKELLIPNEDGTYDYNANLDLSHLHLESFKELKISFRRVLGNVNCAHNDLISLEGAPKIVDDYFSCSYNNLISLRGAPSSVGAFYCHTNRLLSKEHLSNINGIIDYGDSEWKNPFSITKEVIETVSKMTKKQQMAELEFFRKFDTNAFDMLQEILFDLGVDFGTYRKEIFKITKDNDNLKALGY